MTIPFIPPGQIDFYFVCFPLLLVGCCWSHTHTRKNFGNHAALRQGFNYEVKCGNVGLWNRGGSDRINYSDESRADGMASAFALCITFVSAIRSRSHVAPVGSRSIAEAWRGKAGHHVSHSIFSGTRMPPYQPSSRYHSTSLLHQLDLGHGATHRRNMNVTWPTEFPARLHQSVPNSVLHDKQFTNRESNI